MAIAMTSPPASPVVSTGTNLSGEDSSNASAQPMHYEPPVENLVTVAYPSSTAVVVHQHAAPPPASGQARPAHQPPVPLPAAQQAQLVRQPPGPPRARPARAPQPAREYSCKLCGKSYSSHQGLGGHAAGHKNRQKEAEAAAAAAAAMMGQEDGGAFLAAFRRGRRAQPPHECRKCHKVFPTGVELGGHMRMHYTGPPIVHKKNKKWGLVSEDDLRLALSTATEATPPPPAPAVDGRVRLFGIDIDPQVQAPPPPPPEDQRSGTAGGSSSSAGEQE
ncbi:atherin-like [Panicum virgatum]|nr:atherin-like [Panicum virgatum]